jgi:hypothetical protein
VASGDATEAYNGIQNYVYVADIIQNVAVGPGNPSGVGWRRLTYSSNIAKTDTALVAMAPGTLDLRERAYNFATSYDQGATWKYDNAFRETDGTVRAVRRSGYYHMISRYITEAGVGATAVTVVDTASNELDFASHSFKTGDKVTVTAGVGGVVPDGLAAAPVLYARDVSHAGLSISFHPTKADARANTNPITFTDGATPLDVQVPSIDKHKIYMFTCAGDYGAASTNYNTGDMILLQFYADQIEGQGTTAPNYFFPALLLRAGTGSEQQFLQATLEDTQASVGQFFYITRQSSTDDRAKLWLGSMPNTELDKDTPTTFTDHGEFSPFTGHVGLAAAGVNELIMDTRHGKSGVDFYDNHWLAEYCGKNHRIYRNGATNTLLHLVQTHLDESDANVHTNLGIIVIPDYTDFTGDKKPWYLPIKMGREENGIDRSFTEAGFVEDGAGGLYVAYRKCDQNLYNINGGIYAEKIDLTGIGTVAKGKQLISDPWFDNGLAYGVGNLTQWTVGGTTTPTSVGLRGFNSLQLTAGAVDPFAELTIKFATSASTKHIVSGFFSVTDIANCEAKVIVKNNIGTIVHTETLTNHTDPDEWLEFQFEFTAEASTDGDNHTLRFENTGSSGDVHFSCIVAREEFVQMDKTWGVKELSNRPLKEGLTDTETDLEAGFAGSLQVSSDNTVVYWVEDDRFNHKTVMMQHFKAVT